MGLHFACTTVSDQHLVSSQAFKKLLIKESIAKYYYYFLYERSKSRNAIVHKRIKIKTVENLVGKP